MCDHQSLRLACAYAQSDQSLCLSLEYSMSVKLLNKHNLEFLGLTGGYPCQNATLLEITCRGSNHKMVLVSMKMFHFPSTHMNRLSETESSDFKFCRISLFGRDLFFQTIYSLYSISHYLLCFNSLLLLTPLEYSVFENIIENGVLLQWSKCSIFHNIFKSIQNFL